MSIYDTSSLGTTTNKITFNSTNFPIYRVQSRRPQQRSIRDLDIPVPFENGISDFETLIGKTAYIIEGTMYPGGESEYDAGLRALRKLASLEISQDDVLSDDGYVPYVYEEFQSSKQIFMKVLYVDLPETTRKGLVQPFRLVCKVKDPTIYGGTLKQANTGEANFTTASGTAIFQGGEILTNLGFESDVSGWAGFESSVEQSSQEAYTGTYSMKVTRTTGGGGVVLAYNVVSGLTVGQSYTGWGYIKAVAGTNLFIRFSGISGSQVNFTATGEWQRIETQGVAASTSDTLDFGAESADSGDIIYVDSVSLHHTRFSYPIIYGASTSSVSVDANNEGDVPVYPISININGPVNNPKVTNTTTGEYIQVNTNLATSSNSLVIAYDKDSLSVEADGNSVLNSVTSGSTYFKIPPGSNIFQLTGSSIDDDAAAVISFYDGFGL